MTMSPGLRKFALSAHLAFSVGWIGAVIGFLVLVVAAMTTPDAHRLRALWIAMELTGRFAIVPLAVGSLLTGLVMSLGTRWGLFRHYWVVMSLVLTILAVAVLLGNMRAVRHFATLATDTSDVDVGALRAGLRSELLHAGVGLLLLLAVEALNVYKPRGLTRYGQRHLNEGGSARAEWPSSSDEHDGVDAGGASRLMKIVAIVIAVALLIAILHLASGGGRHGPGRHSSAAKRSQVAVTVWQGG